MAGYLKSFRKKIEDFANPRRRNYESLEVDDSTEAIPLQEIEQGEEAEDPGELTTEEGLTDRRNRKMTKLTAVHESKLKQLKLERQESIEELNEEDRRARGDGSWENSQASIDRFNIGFRDRDTRLKALQDRYRSEKSSHFEEMRTRKAAIVSEQEEGLANLRNPKVLSGTTPTPPTSTKLLLQAPETEPVEEVREHINEGAEENEETTARVGEHLKNVDEGIEGEKRSKIQRPGRYDDYVNFGKKAISSAKSAISSYNQGNSNAFSATANAVGSMLQNSITQQYRTKATAIDAQGRLARSYINAPKTIKAQTYYDTGNDLLTAATFGLLAR